jgi:hypothetical protein
VECNSLARLIWLWAQDRNIWLSTAHIPGIANTEADQASRVFNDAIEWSINDDIFEAVCGLFGQPEVVLFASRLNKKVSRFYSWLPDPESVGVDAFTSSWHGELGYAFPPFALIGAVLQKIAQDRAEVILVVPYWPTKSWFTRLGAMLVEQP